MKPALLVLLLLATPTFAGEIVRDEVRGSKAVRIAVSPSPLGLNDDLRVSFAFRGDGVLRFTLPEVPAGWVRRSTATPTDSQVEWVLRPLVPGEAVPLSLDGITLQAASDVESTKFDLERPIFIEVTTTFRTPDPSMTKSGYPFEPLEVAETPPDSNRGIWVAIVVGIALFLGVVRRASRSRTPEPEPTMEDRLREAALPESPDEVRSLDSLLQAWLETQPEAVRVAFAASAAEAQRLIWSAGASAPETRAWWEGVRTLIPRPEPKSPELRSRAYRRRR